MIMVISDYYSNHLSIIMLRLLLIILISSTSLFNTFAQRNIDSGGRGTESTKINRIKRTGNGNNDKPRTVEVKERKPFIPVNFVQPVGEISICGDVVAPGADVVICADNSTNAYSEVDANLELSQIDLGLQKFDEGNYYGAISIFDEEINLNPYVKELYLWRGKAFVAVNEFIKAINDFSTAITFDDYYSEAYYQRGLARFYSGERKKSKEDLKFAYSLGYSRAGYILNKYF